MHNQIWFRSLKNYTLVFLIEELTKINSHDYNIFSNVNIGFLDLFVKILSVVDKIASVKGLRMKNNTQDSFDDEVPEAIKLTETLLKNFKSTKLHIDEALYNEPKYPAMKLIREKKNKTFQKKFKENIGKPKNCGKL